MRTFFRIHHVKGPNRKDMVIWHLVRTLCSKTSLCALTLGHGGHVAAPLMCQIPGSPSWAAAAGRPRPQAAL